MVSNSIGIRNPIPVITEVFAIIRETLDTARDDSQYKYENQEGGRCLD